ncbi:type II toxin-antitoxin system RelB/DinJ family antitoxin [Lactobacillus sp. PSON]|uniref:type II toxin-antitoxin system RelB/DinJ family antitoxin n=1 Tax=Lactobacillus sp. PSON TaxID=3455454 RepID=UPI00404208DC
MSQFSMRMDPNFKKETQDNFKKMGLSMSAATKMFYTFVNKHGYLPFTPTTGKTELEQAIEDAENGIYGHTYNSVEDFKKHLSK